MYKRLLGWLKILPESERRLAAIMFTDMVGYTALGQKYESLSLALVDEQRNLVRPILARHNGKEIKTMGDAFLVEFPNALDAVRCAYDIQRASREFDIALPEDRRIHLRIGVHLGDVIESGNDISGDAVNVASRIEPLAEDGGVCITRQVHDHVEGKFEVTFASLGAQSLKNISKVVDVYKMVMPWSEVATRPESGGTSAERRLAILPFTNMSPDPQDEFFADGMTEEVISTISKIRGLSVISRTSVMRYKQTGKSTTEIGRELNVGKLLEGSVRKSGNRLRITVQLIDAKVDRHIWAETYDRNLQDVFEIQSDIAQRVASAMEAQLMEDDRNDIMQGTTKNPEAHLTYLKGLYFMNRGSREAYPKAIEYFERATVIDPKFALAFAALADCYTYMAGQYMPSKEALPKAKLLAKKAIELNDSSAEGHTSLGNIHMQFDWDWEKAGKELSRAIELNPSYSHAHIWKGIYLALMRRSEEGLEELQRAEELDPLSPLVKLNVGVLLFYTRRYDEAIAKLEDARELEERDEMVYLLSGWSYTAMSMHEEAINALMKGLALGDYADILGGLGYAYAMAGKRKEALETLERLSNLGEKALNPFTNAAIVKVGLGEIDQAIDLMEKALANREEWLVLTCESPIFDTIRTDPHFVDIIQRIGLPH